jgi:integrase
MDSGHLEPHEIQNLLLQLNSSFRLMVLLDVTTGLRRSELLALKWSDVDFSSLELNVVRSIYLRIVGDCKTEASRKPVPLDAHVAAELWLWKEVSAYSKFDDWIFASPHTQGKYPLLAGRSVAENHSAGGAASWNQEENRLAHISTFVLVAPSRKRRECEGRAGVDAACQQPLYA